MESDSNSQHSHPANSASDPASASASWYGCSVDSTGEASSSAGNISGSMQWKSSTPEDEEDMNVNIADSSTSTKPSTGKEKEVDTDDTTSGSREGKAEEIGLLTDLYNLHNKTGRFLFSGGNEQRDFYKFWIEEEGDYANKKELDEKVNELHARFLKNMDKNVEGPTDPIDVEILRLSEWIWGAEIDSDDDYDDEEHDSKDSLDHHANTVEVGKDSTKQSGGSNDSPSKAN